MTADASMKKYSTFQAILVVAHCKWGKARKKSKKGRLKSA